MRFNEAIFLLTEEKRRRVIELVGDKTLIVFPAIISLRKHVPHEELGSCSWLATDIGIFRNGLDEMVDDAVQKPKNPSFLVLPEDDFDPSSTDELAAYMLQFIIYCVRRLLPDVIEKLDNRGLLVSARADAREIVTYVRRNIDKVLDIQREVETYNPVRAYLMFVQLTEYTTRKHMDLWDFLIAVQSLGTEARVGEHAGQWNLAAIRKHMNDYNDNDYNDPRWTIEQVRMISRRVDYRLNKL